MRIDLNDGQSIYGEDAKTVVEVLNNRDHRALRIVERPSTEEYMRATKRRVREQFGEDMDISTAIRFLEELRRLGVIIRINYIHYDP